MRVNVYATIYDLGWRQKAYDVWTTETGQEIRLAQHRPAYVMMKVEEAVTKKLWRESSLSGKDIDGEQEERDGDIPWWYPIREVVLGKNTSEGTAAQYTVVAITDNATGTFGLHSCCYH